MLMRDRVEGDRVEGAGHRAKPEVRLNNEQCTYHLMDLEGGADVSIMI